ncbi:MAG TPA: hypothetical protein DF383_06130 [Deltaproteobacteria bacterium]|nr:hypothetical protein [Deltaproteobacteria bacterium]
MEKEMKKITFAKLAVLVLIFSLADLPISMAAAPGPLQKAQVSQNSESLPSHDLTQEKEVLLYEGKSVDLPHHVKASLKKKSILYGHAPDGNNFAGCILVLRQGKVLKELTLSQEYSGTLEYQEIFALRIALEDVDAYHSPGWAKLRVEVP